MCINRTKAALTRTPDIFCIYPLLCWIDLALMDVMPLCSSHDSLKWMRPVCVCVGVSLGPCSCCRSGPSSLFVFFSFSLTGPAGFFQGAWSIWSFCQAINIDQRSSIPSAPRQRPRVHCVRSPFLYHSPTNPQTALSLYEGILPWPQGHHAGFNVMGDWSTT